MKLLFTLGFFFIFASVSFAQKEGKEKEEKIPYLERDSLYRIHSPRKALLLSAVLPGSGQIYNKKIWKAPIVWAGMGTCVGFISYNTKTYNELKSNYVALNDDDPNTIYASEVPVSIIKDEMERFRKYKEISYIALFGVYALNLLDAYVDGHLFHFDVDENLSASLDPAWNLPSQYNNMGFVGAKVTFTFK